MRLECDRELNAERIVSTLSELMLARSLVVGTTTAGANLARRSEALQPRRGVSLSALRVPGTPRVRYPRGGARRKQLRHSLLYICLLTTRGATGSAAVDASPRHRCPDNIVISLPPARCRRLASSTSRWPAILGTVRSW